MVNYREFLDVTVLSTRSVKSLQACIVRATLLGMS